jgi:hypothetical protein
MVPQPVVGCTDRYVFSTQYVTYRPNVHLVGTVSFSERQFENVYFQHILEEDSSLKDYYTV